MNTRRGANAAPIVTSSSQKHPVSEIVRLAEAKPEGESIETKTRAAQAVAVDDDLYGNLPFTD